MFQTSCVIGLVVAAIPYASLSASTITALGAEQIQARGLLDTKALVVAKLVKRVELQDVAYVVFENVRVIRGKERRKLLVFNHPTPTNHNGFLFHRILKQHVDSLKETQSFLVTIGEGYLPPLVRWIPLTKFNEEAVISRELKPYEDLDKNLKRDPWNAVEDKSLFVQACVLCYYRRFATPEEMKEILKEFAKMEKPSRMRFLLARQVLQNMTERNEACDGELLDRLYRVEIDDKKLVGITTYFQSLVVRQFEHAKPSKYDKLIVEAVNSKNFDLQRSALDVLTRRKFTEAVPGIRKALAAPPYWNLPAKSLQFQVGKQSVDIILGLCVEGPNSGKQLNMSFDFLADTVEMDHIETLQSLDNHEDPEIHAMVTQLLIYAGDKQAEKELLLLVKSGKIKCPPGDFLFSIPSPADARLLQLATAWRESAKWLLAKRRFVDGATLISCAEVLLHLRDPEFGRLILPMVKDDHYSHWAFQYLVLNENEEHRTVFQQYTNDKSCLMRAYAWVGLAQLGDKRALSKVAEFTALAPDEMTRYYLREFILPRIEIAAIRKAWGNDGGVKKTAAERAVHEFVLEQLKISNAKEKNLE